MSAARIIVQLTVISCLALTACGSEDALAPDAAGVASPTGDTTPAAGLPDLLRVGLIPNIAPEEQQARYEPFAEHLGEDLDVEVELFVAADYAGVVAALASERIDVAYLGGLTYVQAEEQVELTPLVTEVDEFTGTPQYESAVVVLDDSPLTSVEELVESGGTFAFGDPSSTSGSLYPRIMLADAGVECEVVDVSACPPLSSVTFTGGHDATAQAMLSGSVDAGGLELRILRRLEDDGAVPQGALRVIDTRRVAGYPWVGRTALGEQALGAVQDSFLAIDDPQLLDLLRAREYVEVSPDDYDEIRERGAELGLVTEFS